MTEPSQTDPIDTPLTGTYDVTLWVPEGAAELTRAQIGEFMDANPGIVINETIETVDHWDAASLVLADIRAAADIYCFSQDLLPQLVGAGALTAPDAAVSEAITANNDAGAVAAASVAGELWCYPMTSDNGYYMYYDTSIISPQEAESLEAIIAACERSGVKFRFDLENAWYSASFFFATGCESVWTMDESGKFAAVNDTFSRRWTITRRRSATCSDRVKRPLSMY